MSLKDKKIAFIGGGHITEILIDNMTRTQTVRPDQLLVSDPDATRQNILSQKFSTSNARNNPDAVQKGDMVFINVRPQVVDDVITELIREGVPTRKILITLAAGVPIKKYLELGTNLPIVRAVPNPPSQIGEGIIALTFNMHVSENQKRDINRLFAPMGKCLELGEDHLNAVTSLSSPAAFFLFFQAMIDAGIKCGLDRNLSTEIVYQTLHGSLEVWKQRKVSPHDLMLEASTPGGISEEIIHILNQYSFPSAIKDSVYWGMLKAGKF